MTVEVDTPSGLRTGSVVREVTRRTPPSLPSIGEDRGSISVRGEAVAVDMPGGRTLFALLSGGDGDGDYGARIADRALRSLPASRDRSTPRPNGPIPWQRFAELWPSHPDTVGLINTTSVPLLVTFGDARDPMSVARVDPDDLAASFGTGVRLRRITIQITDDDVTTGIERRLESEFWQRWSQEHQRQLSKGLVGNTYFQSLQGTLSRNDFTTGAR